jgi:hypothetical protein
VARRRRLIERRDKAAMRLARAEELSGGFRPAAA